MPDISIRLIINLFLIAGALFAVWKGGRPERLAAGIVIVNALVGEAIHPLRRDLLEELRLVNDGLAALALLGVTIRYAAPWMGAIMFFFAAQFSLLSFYMVAERPHDDLKALINNVDWSCITWCLIIGTAMAWHQRSRRLRAPPTAETPFESAP